MTGWLVAAVCLLAPAATLGAGPAAGGAGGEKAAYRLFDGEGRPVAYAALLERLAAAEVVLFGELHNNPIIHWLQSEVARDLADARPQDLVLGAEMFEADNQLVIDEYLAGLIRLQDLEREAKVWPTFGTDYRPLLELARERGRPFIATNIPRRYAALVSREGLGALERLTPRARRHVAPLPVVVDLALPGYHELLEMAAQMPGHAAGAAPEFFPQAQAVKDATMAHFILAHAAPGGLFLHVNGTRHSDRHEGIVWYLRQARPGVNLVTLAAVEQSSVEALEPAARGLADYIVAVPTAMTKTH